MTATILAGHLLGALRVAQLSIPSPYRCAIPVLNCALVAIGGGRATVIGTDMESASVATAAVDGDLPPVAVPARRMVAILSRLSPEAEMRLEADGKLERLLISGGGLSASVVTEPDQDFPTLKQSADHARFTMPAATLRRLLDQTFHAISTEETRYYLNGVFLHVVDGELRAVATDGHRLMASIAHAPEGCQALKPVIVPHKTVGILRFLLPRLTDGQIEIVQREDASLTFSSPRWVIHSKVIDGTFPDYPRVIPKREERHATIAVRMPKALFRLADTAAAISTERSRPVRLSNGEGSALRFDSSCPDSGAASVAVPEEVAAWEGGKSHPEFGLQARYLRQACRGASQGFVMQVIDGSAPVRIDFEGGFGALMPMRV